MYQEIIDEIKSNLGENNQLNQEYLYSQIEKYQNHEYRNEIIKEISRLMWDCLSDEEKNEFIEISKNENPVLDLLNDIYQDIGNNEIKKALLKMDKFMETFHPMYEDDKVNEYHLFTNPLEEILFNKYIGAKKSVRYIPDDQPYLDLYYIYGYLLLEDGQYQKAEEYLKKALKINPVSSRVILELCEIYKIRTPNINKFVMYTEEALKYAYYSQDIGRCYRNLAHYNIEENKFKLASALLKYSLKYDSSPLAYNELNYIESKGKSYELSDLECERELIGNNIQLGPNLFILDTIDELIEEYESNESNAQAIYFYEILYDLTLDENIIEKIRYLKSKLN